MPTSELRDRSVLEPESKTPFDHLHDGKWVVMLEQNREVQDGPRGLRDVSTFICPRCDYSIRLNRRTNKIE